MAVEPRIVEDQLVAIGEGDRWWREREVRELPSILNPDERIHAVVAGKLPKRLRPSRPWVIVVTSDRLICLKLGERFVRKQLDLPMARVTSIAHRVGLLSAKIIVVSGDRSQPIRVSKSDALKLLGALSALIQRIEPRNVAGRTSEQLAPFATQVEQARLQARIDLLEDEVERMRQQLDFLEELLKRRETSALIGSGG
jgi:hypothetical protein